MASPRGASSNVMDAEQVVAVVAKRCPASAIGTTEGSRNLRSCREHASSCETSC